MIKLYQKQKLQKIHNYGYSIWVDQKKDTDRNTIEAVFASETTNWDELMKSAAVR